MKTVIESELILVLCNVVRWKWKSMALFSYDKQDVRHILKINGVIYGAISNETFRINHFWKTIWISIAMYGEFRILLIREFDEWMYIWKTYLIIFVNMFIYPFLISPNKSKIYSCRCNMYRSIVSIHQMTWKKWIQLIGNCINFQEAFVKGYNMEWWIDANCDKMEQIPDAVKYIFRIILKDVTNI